MTAETPKEVVTRFYRAVADRDLEAAGACFHEQAAWLLLDVAVGERFVVAIQHATAHREGKRLDITGCQSMSIEDGKIRSVRGHYSDQQALEDFWS